MNWFRWFWIKHAWGRICLWAFRLWPTIPRPRFDGWIISGMRERSYMPPWKYIKAYGYPLYYKVTEGSGNVAVGYAAFSAISTGIASSAVGDAAPGPFSLDENAAAGWEALNLSEQTTGSDNITYGAKAEQDDDGAIFGDALRNNTIGGNRNDALGGDALRVTDDHGLCPVCVRGRVTTFEDTKPCHQKWFGTPGGHKCYLDGLRKRGCFYLQ